MAAAALVNNAMTYWLKRPLDDGASNPDADDADAPPDAPAAADAPPPPEAAAAHETASITAICLVATTAGGVGGQTSPNVAASSDANAASADTQGMAMLSPPTDTVRGGASGAFGGDETRRSGGDSGALRSRSAPTTGGDITKELALVSVNGSVMSRGRGGVGDKGSPVAEGMMLRSLVEVADAVNVSPDGGI